MVEQYPVFSIIIPTRNRPKELDSCLQAITRLEYPADCFEVIVVDDGGYGSPAAVVDRFRQRINVTLFSQAHGGPSAARNAGAKRAGGNLLAFTDDDCMPKADWLQKLAARFARTPDHLIGGRTLNRLNKNPYSTASQIIVDLVYAYYNADPSNARFLASNNVAIPAGQFHEIGGFDINFRTSEDRELCDRWRYHDFQMTYAPEAVIYHAHALTLGSFLSQHFGYGRGAFRFHQTRARRGSGHFVQELEFYRHFPSLLARRLSRLHRTQPLSVAPLLLAWQAANAAGFLWEMSQSKRIKEAKPVPRDGAQASPEKSNP